MSQPIQNAAPAAPAENNATAEQNNISQENQSDSTVEISAETDAAEQLKETITDPNVSKQEKKEAVKQLKKLKLKIDGQEIEEEFDLNDDEYLKKQLQLAKVAHKRMNEKSAIEKEVMRFVEDLRKNPRKALSDPAIGLDLKKLAAEIIEEEIENSKKSPQQLEKEKLESELKTLKEEREKEKEEGRKKEFERLKEQEYERYDMLMSKALEKTDLPKSPYVVKKMADYMLLGLQEGKDVSPEDVIPLVREEITEDLKQMFAIMPEDVVEALIGKDVINRIRKKNIAKAKQQNPALAAPTKVADTGKVANAEKDNEPKQTFKQFFKF